MDMDRITQTEVGPHFDHRLDINIRAQSGYGGSSDLISAQGLANTGYDDSLRFHLYIHLITSLYLNILSSTV